MGGVKSLLTAAAAAAACPEEILQQSLHIECKLEPPPSANKKRENPDFISFPLALGCLYFSVFSHTLLSLNPVVLFGTPVIYCRLTSTFIMSTF